MRDEQKQTPQDVYGEAMVRVLVCKLEDLTFSEMSRHLRFFWEVAEHVCFAFPFVVLLPFGVAVPRRRV